MNHSQTFSTYFSDINVLKTRRGKLRKFYEVETGGFKEKNKF